MVSNTTVAGVQVDDGAAERLAVRTFDRDLLADDDGLAGLDDDARREVVGDAAQHQHHDDKSDDDHRDQRLHIRAEEREPDPDAEEQQRVLHEAAGEADRLG